MCLSVSLQCISALYGFICLVLIINLYYFVLHIISGCMPALGHQGTTGFPVVSPSGGTATEQPAGQWAGHMAPSFKCAASAAKGTVWPRHGAQHCHSVPRGQRPPPFWLCGGQVGRRHTEGTKHDYGPTPGRQNSTRDSEFWGTDWACTHYRWNYLWFKSAT